MSEVFVLMPICSHSEEIALPSEIDFGRNKLREARVSGGTAANMFALRKKIQFLPTGFSEYQLPTGMLPVGAAYPAKRVVIHV